MEWEDKKQVKKGSIGERLVKAFLAEKGFINYEPETKGPHAFDILAVKDKQTVIIAEVKSKARRTYYPDTGFNYAHYSDYTRIRDKHQLRVFIFFVDEHEKKIYGNWLDILEEKKTITYNGKEIQYPLMQKDIIYFPLESMKDICTIEDEVAEQLEVNSTRNYVY